MRDTYSEWAVRDANGDDGDMYGWWPREDAVRQLQRRRSHHPEHGPYQLIRRTWTCVDEVEDEPI